MPRTQPPDPALGTALRQIRIDRELSQEEVSHASNVSLGTYGKIERNAVAPGWPTVRLIAKALGITMQQLGEAVDKQD